MLDEEICCDAEERSENTFFVVVGGGGVTVDVALHYSLYCSASECLFLILLFFCVCVYAVAQQLRLSCYFCLLLHPLFDQFLNATLHVYPP